MALILAVGVIVAACSGDGEAANTTSASMEFADGGESAAPGEGEESATTDSGEGAIAVDLEVAQDRKVIRQAQLQLEADDTRAALDRIIALSEAAGGFVADATVHPVEGEQDQPSANITVRI
ncbi:MAG: DUF4349 domain-containing protein, partial [Acidimicrobiia bacterium]